MKIKEVIIPFEIEQKLIWKHNVLDYEVKEVVTGNPRIKFAAKGQVKGEDLYTASGQTAAGRYLVVFFLKKENGQGLVISARDMDAKERKSYEKKRS